MPVALQTAIPLVLILVLLGILFLSRREAARARERLATIELYRQDMLNLVGLARTMSKEGVQSSPEPLLEGAIRLGYATGAVVYSRSETGNLEVRFTAGQAPVDAGPGHELALHRAMASRQVWHDEAAGRLCVPLLDGGEPIGLVDFAGLPARPGGGASEAQAAFLEAVAELTGISLATQRTFQRQLALSATDGLTGVYNHRHFQQLLGVALAQSYLQASALTLVLFDIDHFKRVNDTYGHLFGDLVLREVAQIARRHAPPAALVARYGGEEFAVVLPGVGTDAAVAFAERLREAVAGHTILDYQTGKQLQITISLGVATYQLGQGKSRLIARADEALYASKRSGRNRVTVAEPDHI